jgi:serine/threonine protein phosphatase PrpC
LARVAPLTDAGRKRGHNEDNHLILPLDGSGAPPSGEVSTLSIAATGVLLAVADGMGGHHAGEVASRLCVENLAREIRAHLQASGNGHPDLPSALREAVVATHRAVFSYAREFADKQTMGTTLTAALVSGARAEVAQVGDSRAYLFRDGNLILLTQDQTIGNRLRNRGEDPSLVNAQIKDLLTQAVGAQPEINVIMTAIDVEPQDMLLLCSDGLYKVVSAQELVDILELEIPLAEKASHLIARGNENGGPDNITVILVEIGPAQAAS